MRALILAPFSDAGLDRLRASIDITYEPWLDTDRIYDPDELGARLAADGADILVIEADFVFEEVFAAAPCLRLVGVCRNALNHVDLDAATEAGVVVLHARGRNTNAVAEMTLGLMFALCRRLLPAHTLVSGAGWTDPVAGYRLFRAREMAGSNVGVIGFGQIGREVARKCIALDARVLVYDPFVPAAEIEALGASPVSLDPLASASDFVTLHVADTDDSAGMIGAAFLERMKPDAYLINTGAGAAVNPLALADALNAGTIAGAALDVFEGQPLPVSSPLLTARNLILTPHIAGATDETVERQSEIMASEIERFIAGQPLQYAVNVPATPASAR